MKHVGVTSRDKGRRKKTTKIKQHQSHFELQKGKDCNCMVLLVKSFDTIDFRSTELIEMALCVQLDYSQSDIAELSRDK